MTKWSAQVNSIKSHARSNKMTIEGLVPAIEIKETDKIDEAINDLRKVSASFGVVISVRGEKIGLIQADDLAKAEGHKTIKTVVPENQGLSIVESPETLAEVVESKAKYLELRPNLPGIVVTKQDKVIGVLPRNKIITEASRVVTRGAGISRMEGPPLGALFFICPQDNERKMVSYYEGKPPKCSQGHVMKLDESDW
jgi:predicted transcriptional regulator